MNVDLFVGFVKWNIFIPLPESNLEVWMILVLQKGWQGRNHDLPDHGILSNRTWNDSKDPYEDPLNIRNLPVLGLRGTRTEQVVYSP